LRHRGDLNSEISIVPKSVFVPTPIQSLKTAFSIALTDLARRKPVYISLLSPLSIKELPYQQRQAIWGERDATHAASAAPEDKALFAFSGNVRDLLEGSDWSGQMPKIADESGIP